jgi:hypothetical protein
MKQALKTQHIPRQKVDPVLTQAFVKSSSSMAQLKSQQNAINKKHRINNLHNSNLKSEYQPVTYDI